MPTTKRTRKAAKQPSRSNETLSRYKSEAKEIEAAKQAMLRVRRGVEFEPDRLHYIIETHSAL